MTFGGGIDRLEVRLPPSAVTPVSGQDPAPTPPALPQPPLPPPNPGPVQEPLPIQNPDGTFNAPPFYPDQDWLDYVRQDPGFPFTPGPDNPIFRSPPGNPYFPIDDPTDPIPPEVPPPTPPPPLPSTPVTPSPQSPY